MVVMSKRNDCVNTKVIEVRDMEKGEEEKVRE